MSAFEPHVILAEVFSRLRRRGFSLGVGEYLAAGEAVDRNFDRCQEDPKALKSVLQLLWCNSCDEHDMYRRIWDAVLPETKSHDDIGKEQKDSDESEPVDKPDREPDIIPKPPDPERPIPVPQTAQAELSSVPVRSPFIPIDSDDTPELQAHFPLSRRDMIYAWRYLRRFVANGAIDVLDIAATVEQVAAQGFYLAPVYGRRKVNCARLLLLIDQDGSMTPFHRFTRELAETAQQESKIERVDVYYFHNIIAENVHRNRYLTDPIPFRDVLAECDDDTSVTIVSDAGAARRDRRLPRIQSTTEFLFRINQRTSLIAWLNPMPKTRWVSTSAQIISHLVPMYPMTKEGMSHAVDILRGQSLPV